MGLSVVKDDKNEPWDYPAPEGGDVGKTDNTLADAAGDALDQGTGPDLTLVGEQTTTMPACKVKFNGMSFDSLDEVPDLRDEVAYLAVGRVNGHEDLISAQGDLRQVAKVKVGKVRAIPAEKLDEILAILDR